MTQDKTIYKQIAADLNCSYTHVKQVLAKNSKLSKQTKLNKKIVLLYIQKEEEELEQLRASITERATNDYILK